MHFDKRVSALGFFFLIILTFPPYKVSATTATTAVDPAVSNVSAGISLSVNITVGNIANCTSWQLDLYYLNSVLNCTNAIEGPFLKAVAGTYFGKTITNNYNATHGRLLAYCTIFGMNSANGSGVITTVTFKSIGGGSTLLHLSDIKLGDEKIPPQDIPYTATDGTVNVIGGFHDVAAQNLTSLKTVVGQGYSNNFTVTVQNLGTFQETFNVSVSANATELVRTEVIVAAGNSLSIIMSWNTSGFPYGNYSISAYVWPVPNETNTGNNLFIDGRLIVGIPGDVNGDGTVNILDAIKLANAFLATPGSGNWNPNADINGDGVVNILDAIILSNHFLQQQLYDP